MDESPYNNDLSNFTRFSGTADIGTNRQLDSSTSQQSNSLFIKPPNNDTLGHLSNVRVQPEYRPWMTDCDRLKTQSSKQTDSNMDRPAPVESRAPLDLRLPLNLCLSPEHPSQHEHGLYEQLKVDHQLKPEQKITRGEQLKEDYQFKPDHNFLTKVVISDHDMISDKWLGMDRNVLFNHRLTTDPWPLERRLPLDDRFNRDDSVSSSHGVDDRTLLETNGSDLLFNPKLQFDLVHMKQYFQLQKERLDRQHEQQRQLLECEERARLANYLLQTEQLQQQRQQKQLELLERGRCEGLKERGGVRDQRQGVEGVSDRRQPRREGVTKSVTTRDKLDKIKHKNKDEESAIASAEVKQLLRKALLNKSRTTSSRTVGVSSAQLSGLSHAAVSSDRTNVINPVRATHPHLRSIGVAERHSLEHSDLPLGSGYRRSQVSTHGGEQEGTEGGEEGGGYNPLRKTVSEPNLKMRSKLFVRHQGAPKHIDRHNATTGALHLSKQLSIDGAESEGGANHHHPFHLLPAHQQQDLNVKQYFERAAAIFPHAMINQSMPLLPHRSDNESCAMEMQMSHLAALSSSVSSPYYPRLPPSLHALHSSLNAGRTTPPHYPPPVGSCYYPSPGDTGRVLDNGRLLGSRSWVGGVNPYPYFSTYPYPCKTYIPQSSVPSLNDIPLHRIARMSRTYSEPMPLPQQLLRQQQQLLLQQQQLVQQQQQIGVQAPATHMTHYDTDKQATTSIENGAAHTAHCAVTCTEASDASLVHDHTTSLAHDHETSLAGDNVTSLPHDHGTSLAHANVALQAHNHRIPPASDNVTSREMSELCSSGRRLGRRGRQCREQTSVSEEEEGEGVERGEGMNDVDVVMSSSEEPPSFSTGVAYDVRMLRHECLCGGAVESHPENSLRIQSIWTRLEKTGLLAQCQVCGEFGNKKRNMVSSCELVYSNLTKVLSRPTSIDELTTCHSETYVKLYGNEPANNILRQHDNDEEMQLLLSRFCALSCGGIGVDADTVWNPAYTPLAARIAVGCVIELATCVAEGQLENGFAIVRPPGHHAEQSLAMGFCFFNSIAIAAKLLLAQSKISKILIVDWDVHHGNSTQPLFYSDPRVLYISLHRHDNGHFFPGTGAASECGSGRGEGFNVNIAWEGGLNPPMGDAEYLAAFRTVVLPIAREFSPDITLVSAGFDAARGHPAPLGGYNLSPQCFAYMTQQLQELSRGGKVVLILEGGYNIKSMTDSAELCLRALLKLPVERIDQSEMERRPCSVAIDSLVTVIKYQAAYWPCLARYSRSVGWSWVESEQGGPEDLDPLSNFASLSVLPHKNKLSPITGND